MRFRSHLNGDRFNLQDGALTRITARVGAGALDEVAVGAKLVIKQLQALLALVTSWEQPPKKVGSGTGLAGRVVYSAQKAYMDDEYRGSIMFRKQLS